MLRLRRGRQVVTVAVAALALSAAAPVASAAGGTEPSCEEGADERFEYWNPVCEQDPEIVTGAGPEICRYDGPVDPRALPCVDELYGWWSYNWQCYLRFVTPQPPAEDPAWKGNDPQDGFVYRVACPWLEGLDGLPWTDHVFLWFLPASSGTIARLVEDAIDRLPITGPDVHIVPDPSGVGLVGLPVWMWTRVSEETWEPPPLRVGPMLGWMLVVEASVDRIVWDMGNGDSVVCDRGPGTPYRDEYGAQQSPDCGYQGYERPSSSRPDGVYPVTGTTHWNIGWQFEDAQGRPTSLGGTETTARESPPVPIRINELQVVSS